MVVKSPSEGETERMSKTNLASGTKYQLLLAAAQHGTCYNPACTERLLVTRAGKTIANFEFAHIRDDQRPKDPAADLGWRYWPDDLPSDQRNHFSNIALLCQACHKLIDKVDPRSYSVELLREWKTQAEGNLGPNLAMAVGSMTTEELESLILSALKSYAPTRDVRVTLAAAFIDAASAIQVSLKGAQRMLEQNPLLRDRQAAISVTATNHGELAASVTSFDLELRRPGREHHPVLMSPNPVGVNPALPVRLDSGASQTWIFHTDQLRATVKAYGEAAVFTDVVGIARLATGEASASESVGAEHIPMWDDPAEVAVLFEKMRSDL
jgi:hypothetical protein